MQIEFSGPITEWRGPAPFYFVALPAEVCEELDVVASEASYGWGCIPVEVTIGDTTFYTALIPREGSYFVPLKVAVRKAEGIELGEPVSVQLSLRG